VNSEFKGFQEKWTDVYFCDLMNGNALRLNCSEGAAVWKEYDVFMHYNSKHKVQICVAALWIEKVAALGLESQQNVFRKQFNDSFSALQTTYYVAR